MPAGNLPKRERRSAVTYLVEHATALDVMHLYCKSSADKLRRKTQSQTIAAPVAPRASVPSASIRSSQKAKSPPPKNLARKPKFQKLKKPIAVRTTRKEASRRKAMPPKHNKPPRQLKPSSVKALSKKNPQPPAKRRGRPTKQQQQDLSRLSVQPAKGSPTPMTTRHSQPTRNEERSAPPKVSPQPLLHAFHITGQRWDVQYDADMRLADLKKTLERLAGSPAATTTILFQGVELTDSTKSLRSFGVTEGSCLFFLTVR